MKKIKVFECFAGIGTQRMALRNLGVNFQSVGISEIDIPAILSYSAIHDNLSSTEIEYPTKEEMIDFLTTKNIGFNFKSKKVILPKQLDKLKQLYKATILSKCYGDVSLLNPNELPDFDLFTYSFPCQDLSVAGLTAGMLRNQTRSGLLYECEKIIEVKRPKYLLLENVKNLVGKQFKSQFEEWLNYLETLGYTNYWKVLNAKHYGVPQNRERVFVVSILGDHKPYEFPQPTTTVHKIKDILQSKVEDKYYINKPFKLVDKGHQAELLNTPYEQAARVYSEYNVMKTLCTRGDNNILVCAKVDGLNNQTSRVFNVNGICSTLDTTQGGYREPKILTENDFRVRKLTPLECWRLMGVSDDNYNKVKQIGMSNSQLYKQAGNAIVVNVLEHIFKNLFDED